MDKATFSIEIGEKSLVIPKEVFEQMKIQVETKDGEVVECDIDTSVLSELKGDKCDNNHDCEHCDWVECPLDKENKQ